MYVNINKPNKIMLNLPLDIVLSICIVKYGKFRSSVPNLFQLPSHFNR